MAASILSETARVVYESPCQRIRIERRAPRDFWMFLDDTFIGAREFAYKAEADAHTALTEAITDEEAAAADGAAVYAEVMADVAVVAPVMAAELEHEAQIGAE